MPQFTLVYAKKSDGLVRQAVFTAEDFPAAARAVEAARDGGVEAVSLGETETWSGMFRSPQRLIALAAVAGPMLILFVRSMMRVYAGAGEAGGSGGRAVAIGLTIFMVLLVGIGAYGQSRAVARLRAAFPSTDLASAIARADETARWNSWARSPWFPIVALVCMSLVPLETLFTVPEAQLKGLFGVAAFMVFAASILILPTTRRRAQRCM